MVGPQASPGHGGGWPWDERSFLLVAPADSCLFSFLALTGQGLPGLSLLGNSVSPAVTSAGSPPLADLPSVSGCLGAWSGVSSL